VGKQARVLSRATRTSAALVRQRTQKRNRSFAIGGGLIIVALLVAIVVSLVTAGTGNGTDSGSTTKPLVAPAAVANGAIIVGKATAPVKVEVYLDYMCPYCGRFERANAGELERLVADGTISVHLYPLSFLDRTSDGTRYSTRAANAIAAVADQTPGSVLAFNNALFARQPAEGSAGLSNDEIASLAANAGVPQDVVARFGEGTFEPWIAKYTEAAFSGGITGTPTVKINGKIFQGDLYSAGPLTQAINSAKG
jgi:protein-disulfide isomerase